MAGKLRKEKICPVIKNWNINAIDKLCKLPDLDVPFLCDCATYCPVVFMLRGKEKLFESYLKTQRLTHLGHPPLKLEDLPEDSQMELQALMEEEKKHQNDIIAACKIAINNYLANHLYEGWSKWNNYIDEPAETPARFFYFEIQSIFLPCFSLRFSQVT